MTDQEVIDFKMAKMIRESLIEQGWTPPKDNDNNEKYTISIQPEQRDNKHVELCDALFCLLSHYEQHLSLDDQSRCLKFAIENNTKVT